MARVRGVRVVLGGKVEHAGAANVVEQRLGPLGQQPLEEDSFAQPCFRHFNCFEAAGFEHFSDDDRAGKDDVAASRFDSGDEAAVSRIHLSKPFDQIIELAALDLEALDAKLGGSFSALNRRREVADGAADANDPWPAVAEPAR